jgi:large conductance mechanosensitive channel
VDDLIMPIVSPVLSRAGGDWRNLTVTPLHFKVGHLMGTLIDFLLVAFAIFIFVVKSMGALRARLGPTAPQTKTCAECLENIPLAAKRCRACGSVT